MKINKSICPYDCPTSCGLVIETDGKKILKVDNEIIIEEQENMEFYKAVIDKINFNEFGKIVKINDDIEISIEQLINKVLNKFDLTPRGIINYLDLQKPIYKSTTNYGHFGKENLSWEKIIKL